MGWQTFSVIQLFAGNTIINPTGILVYSGAPAAGNLISSIAPAGGTDPYGNHFLAGTASYGATAAAKLDAGLINFYVGSLAAGWTAEASISVDGSGNLTIAPVAKTTLQAAAEITGNLTVDGTLSVGGSTNTGASPNTGFFNTQGLASGSYGSTHQHTLPNFTTATHIHPF